MSPALPRRRPSIRWVFVVPFVVQVTAAVMLTGWLSLRHSQAAVQELARQLRQEQAARIEAHLRDFLEQPHRINQLNANAIHLGQLDINDPQALSRHFWNQLHLFDVAHIYFGNPQGGFAGAGPRADGTLSLTQTENFRRGKFLVFGTDPEGRPTELLRRSENDYDARLRPWYQAAQLAGKASWGRVFPSFNNAELNLAPSQPVYDENGELLGVLAADLQLVQLSEFLQTFKLEQGGSIYIVDTLGRLIASSGSEPLVLNREGKEVRLQAAASQDPSIRATDRFLRAHYGRYGAIAASQQLDFPFNGERKFIQVTPLRDERGLTWWIVLLIPESNFSANIAQNRRTTIWLCLGALAIALLVGSITSQWLVQPLLTLRQATHDIAAGALQRRVPRFAFGELNDLAAAFNRMAEHLQATFRDLEGRQAKLEEAQHMAHIGNWEYLPAQGQLLGSAELWRIAGYATPPPGLTLRAALRHIPRPDRRRLYPLLRASLTDSQAYDLELGLRRLDGEVRQVYALSRAHRDRQQRVGRVHGTIMDVTDQRQAEAALQVAEANYRSIFENAIEGIFCFSPAGEYLSANPALVRLYGYPSLQELLAQRHTDHYVEPQRAQEWLATLQVSDRLCNFESQVYRADGSRIWVSENIRAVRDAEGRLLRYEGSVEDITQRHQIEAQLRHSAYYDSLTHLPNRAAFMEHLQMAIAQAQSDPCYQFAVLFLDLDRFKLVNDSLGHVLGDRLLVAIADSLRTSLNLQEPAPPPLLHTGLDTDPPLGTSQPLIARFGGDEFIILLTDLTGVEMAIAIAEQILQVLRTPFDLDGNTVFVNTSIGIALSTTGGYRAETFLRNADIALHRAKAEGGNGYEVFNTVMHAQAVGRLQLENDLRHSLAQEELTLYYQPIVAVSTCRIVGFEALVRWNHPLEGFISPSKFIPIAEETGLIIPLGQWVLEQACRQMQSWQHQFPYTQALSMGVNLSGRQFAQPNLLGQIAQVLEATHLPPQNLRLELTESTLMSKAQASSAILKRLSELGVRLSVDDFGTGYSSLSYLYQFQLHVLKIDRSFVRHLGDRDESIEIVGAIITLAHSLGMGVVAEGVETEVQLNCLVSLGCEQVQGYLFAPPLPADRATTLLAEAPCFAKLL